MPRRQASLVVSLLVIAMALAGCGGDAPSLEDVVDNVAEQAADALGDEPDVAEGEAAGEEELPPLAFTYSGDTGPENWASLPDNEACAGSSQSPVDVSGPVPVDVADPEISYGPTNVNIENNGHTVKVTYDPGSSLTLDGTTFALAQLHAHAPSEHTVDGRSFPMEIHLVHQVAAGGPYAVLGLLVEEGEANTNLAPFFDSIPTERAESPTTVPGATIDASTLLPASLDTYRYDGSFTTPPCTEGVTWMIAATPITASSEQIAAFTSVLSGNNRPVQATNDREIGLDSQAS